MAIRKDVDYPGRWESATSEYPMGKPKNRTTSTSKDGSYLEKKWIQDYEAFLGAMMNEAGITPDGVVDTAKSSQFFDSMARMREVDPKNNDWNGYLDPDHQNQLPSPDGYPSDSGSGGTIYSINSEWSLNCFSGSDGNTISSDSDGVIFSGSIYKKYEYSAEQLALIDVDKVPIFIKSQDGSGFYFKNGDTGVTVSKSGTVLTVTLDSSIFGVNGINKIWRFFVTEKIGHVIELSANEVEFRVRGGFLIIPDSTWRVKVYRDKSVSMQASFPTPTIPPGTFGSVEMIFPLTLESGVDVILCTSDNLGGNGESMISYERSTSGVKCIARVDNNSASSRSCYVNISVDGVLL